MLSIRHLDAYYGKVQALTDINIEIPDRKIVALLGPNGAGKTTTMMSVSGVVKTGHETSILMDGTDIAHMRPEKVVRHGVAQVPQGRGVFPGLTIKENLVMGAYLRKNRREIEQDIERVIDMFPRLKTRFNQLAGTLSGGEQQMLAIMRGLMPRPKLLMLDEPSMGLAPIIVDQIYETIARISQSGMTLFLVEQNTYMALQYADYAYILSSGRIVSEGSGEELRKDDKMIKSYFKSE